jgi:hypothetical protein
MGGSLADVFVTITMVRRGIMVRVTAGCCRASMSGAIRRAVLVTTEGIMVNYMLAVSSCDNGAVENSSFFCRSLLC